MLQTYTLKNLIRLTVCGIVFAISGEVYTQEVIFLHQSIGKYLYNEGEIPSRIDSYNQSNGTSIKISERTFPYDPWTYNFPYDYWKLWVDGSCNSGNPNIECLNTLVENYDLVIFKHCAPAARVNEDIGVPDVTSETKRLEIYKEQYRALRALFDSYPGTKFMVWTLTPLHRLGTSESKAKRAYEFVQWVKSDWLTEDGKSHPNITVFDFFSLAAELEENPENGVQYTLKYEYERHHDDDEAHPNLLANQTIAPLFTQAIIDALGDVQQVNVTGISVSGASGANTITSPGGTLQLSATVSPENASNKTVTWSIQNGTGQATISENGLVTAVASGTVTATATASDGSGVHSSMDITISSLQIMVTNIVIYGDDFITTISEPGGTLQMHATIEPENATNKSVTWDVINGSGQASISQEGLLTAIADGEVQIKGTAVDGSGVSGVLKVTLSNQALPTGLSDDRVNSVFATVNRSEIILHLKEKSPYDQISLYSGTGSLVRHQIIKGNLHTIDGSALIPGVYIIVLSGNGEVWKTKVVVP